MVRGKAKNTNKMAKSERQRKAARMYLTGKTQYMIADMLGVNVSTICRDLADVAKTWKDEAIKDISLVKEMELKKLDTLEAQAAEMYESTLEAKWLDIRLKAMDRRTKLIGLDAAIESKVRMDADLTHGGNININLLDADCGED